MKYLLLSLSLLLPGISPADEPFAGLWVMRPELTTFSERALDVLIERNSFRQTDCGDPLEVPTDGMDHPIIGRPLFDSMAVRLVDRRKIEITQKVGGKVAWKGTYTVSRDQRQMTLAYEDDRASNAVSGTIQYSRLGEPLSGAHSVSGRWRAEKLLQLSPSALTLRIQSLDGSLKLQWSDGRSVESKLDPGNYILNGYLPGAGVSVLRSRPDMLALNRTQNSVVVEVSRAYLSEDSQTLRYGQVDWLCRAPVYFNYQRQTEGAPTP
jgi:hypothetical protein